MNASRLVLPLVALLLGGVLDVPAQQTEAARKRFEDFKAKAVDQGLAEAQFNLGNSYVKGEGVPKDDAEAVMWFLKAAEQNDADAQHNLGVCYANGKGVAKDGVEGYKWWLLASAQGDEDAKKNMTAIESKMTQEQIVEGKQRANDWLERRKQPSTNTR